MRVYYDFAVNKFHTDAGIMADAGETDPEVDLNIEQQVGRRRVALQGLSIKSATAYEQFGHEYYHKNRKWDDIKNVQHGRLRLYATDQSIEVRDYSEIFAQIDEAFSAFRLICNRPKSHLKAVNEVRPIDTVKRVGYESIPYLASHSEDWLARTASGLKPARLFSRVEEDDYQIYENRVVKTLIDLIISFLRKTEKQLRDQREQLGIISGDVEMVSFGYDRGFQKAISELISTTDKEIEYRSKSLDLARELQATATRLLKSYRSLRQSQLYRYLKKSRPVSGSLNETNILVMDKNYSVIFKLWKAIHKEIVPRNEEEDVQIPYERTCENYRNFCVVLCEYAAHILGFTPIREGYYERAQDSIGLDILYDGGREGSIRVHLRDIEPNEAMVPSNLELPIKAGETQYRFTYDGRHLRWPKDITMDEAESLCTMFKTRESRGKEQYEEKRRYNELKAWLDQELRNCDMAIDCGFTIIPAAVQITADSGRSYRTVIEKLARRIREDYPNELIIAAMPLCNEDEQKITDYARDDDQEVAYLPLTMFDINSYRRLQNILYRQILSIGKDTCPNCGKVMRRYDNQFVCDDCDQLVVTRTICANPDCKHEYRYMGYSVSDDVIQRMQSVDPESFYERDSMYQYRNVVDMSVGEGKIRPVCPCCHR